MRKDRHIPTSHRETTGERSRGARPLYGVPSIPLVLTRDALNTRGSAGRTVPYLASNNGLWSMNQPCIRLQVGGSPATLTFDYSFTGARTRREATPGVGDGERRPQRPETERE